MSAMTNALTRLAQIGNAKETAQSPRYRLFRQVLLRVATFGIIAVTYVICSRLVLAH